MSKTSIAIKYGRLIVLLTISAPLAFSQAARWDIPFILTTNQSAPQPGGMYPVLAIPNATVSICSGTPCTLATTYTSAAGTVACPLTAQLTRGTSTACYSTSDTQGGAGAWLLPGAYQYTVTTAYDTYGPYPFGVDAAGLYLPLAGGTVTGLTQVKASLTGNVNGWANPLVYGIVSNQSANTVTATGTSGTGALTLSATSDYVAGDGVMIAHGGAACGTQKSAACPTGPTPTVAPQGAGGGTTYAYKLACIDGLGGIGVAGTAGSTASGNATLAGVVNGTAPLAGNYNRVTWTGSATCYEVAIYRNNVLIGSQWSGTTGTQTFNDVGLTAWTNRDLPAAAPAVALPDNYSGIITNLVGTAATVSPNLGTSITAATVYHDDAPLMQAALAVSPFVDIPQGNYIFRYPINYTKHNSSFTNAGHIRGPANILCDTGDICIDATGDQNIKFENFNLQAGSSSIQLYLSRDTSNGDLAQAITTDHVSFVAGTDSANTFSHTSGGRGIVGIYNHAAEIQHNLYPQFQADRWMVLTSNNVDNVASVFSATDDRGTNSMSQVDCYSCFGGGYVFAELEDAFTVNFDNGYGLGGFLDLRHQWGFEVDAGESGRLKINGFRNEGKNGLVSVAAGAQLQEPYLWSDLYRVQSPPNALATVAQVWLNSGATLSNAALVQVDDYGGSGANVAPIVDGVSCSIANSKLIVGFWQSAGSCSISGASNTITGFGQGDFSIPPSIGLNGSISSSTWIKVGTWVTSNPAQGDTLGLTLFSGSGFTSGTDFPNRADIIVRIGNGNGSLPNLSGAKLFSFGAATYDNLKIVATGGSTSTTNSSWDIYVHQVSAFAGGSYRVDKFPADQWTNIGTTVSDPGAGSTSILVGDVATIPTAASVVTSIDSQNGDFTFGGAGVSHVGNAYTFSGGAGVSSINSTTGAFTFTGSGVSCTTTTCTFSGTGSGVTSVALTTPSWLTVAGSPVTTSGTLAVTATGAQTANQFLATPNGSTGAVGLRAIVAADIPNLPESQITNLTADLAAKVATTTTVNGHALSANVTVSATDISTGTLPAAQLPAQYKIKPCGGAGIGDGQNVIPITPTPTYPINYQCYNDYGVTYTITSIQCASALGSPTVTVADNSGNALLTGPITATSTWAAGTQSATTTLAAGAWVNWSFVADGVSKQIQCKIKGTI